VNSKLFELSIEPPSTSSDAAQFARQVLSEVLSDPLEVLSARPTCCQCFGDRCQLGLGGLLMKVVGHRLGQFDGEEGLDAGVEVEGFTGPAGSDCHGLGMVDAVHAG
jgi:hypothetical protein